MPKPKPPADLVTIATAAAKKGKPKKTLQTWINRGKIRSWPFGPQVRVVSLAEVMAYEPGPRGPKPKRLPQK